MQRNDMCNECVSKTEELKRTKNKEIISFKNIIKSSQQHIVDGGNLIIVD